MTGRRRLQVTLGVLVAAPFVSAAREIALGAGGVPGESPELTPSVDSALRYANAFKLAAAPVVWSQLGRVERSPEVTYVLSTLFLGGITRLVSWRHRGRPHPVTLGALGLELGAAPLLILWQRQVARAGAPR